MDQRVKLRGFWLLSTNDVGGCDLLRAYSSGLPVVGGIIHPRMIVLLVVDPGIYVLVYVVCVFAGDVYSKICKEQRWRRRDKIEMILSIDFTSLLPSIRLSCVLCPSVLSS